MPLLQLSRRLLRQRINAELSARNRPAQSQGEPDVGSTSVLTVTESTDLCLL